jgi:hypothetical protein
MVSGGFNVSSNWLLCNSCVIVTGNIYKLPFEEKKIMFNYYRKTIIGLYDALKLIKNQPVTNMQQVYPLQIKLLKKIIQIEKRKNLKKLALIELKKSFNVKQRIEKQIAIRNKNKLKKIIHMIDSYGHIIWVLKEIGDALAHIYLPSEDIKTLANKEAPGTIFDKVGHKLEKKLWAFAAKSGALAFINDTTNCLRHGDITLLKENRPVLTMEIKSSRNKNARTSRQYENLQSAISYINKDHVVDCCDEYRRILSNCEYKDNINVLNEVIYKAKLKYCCITRPVEEGLYYVANYGGIKTFDAPTRIMDHTKGEANLIISHVNLFKFNNCGYYPFTLSIEDSAALVDFYTGELSILVVINISYIKKRLGANEIEIEFINGNEKIRIWTEEYEFYILPRYLEKIFVEFMSLENFIKEILWVSSNYSTIIKGGNIARI